MIYKRKLFETIVTFISLDKNKFKLNLVSKIENAGKTTPSGDLTVAI